ncbi:MAG: hypothetical protein P4M04_04720 [Acidobacteriota bacterium]|nr:hypothetical protein [Acidobacteriota bacterium]
MDHTFCPQFRPRRQETSAPRERSSAGHAPLIIRTCRHIVDNDRYCQAAALRGRRYCAAHVVLRGRRWRMARARRRIQARFHIPDLVDMYAVRLAMVRVRPHREKERRPDVLRPADGGFQSALHGTARRVFRLC